MYAKVLGKEWLESESKAEEQGRILNLVFEASIAKGSKNEIALEEKALKLSTSRALAPVRIDDDRVNVPCIGRCAAPPSCMVDPKPHYVGCFVDTFKQRTLDFLGLHDDTVAVLTCKSVCEGYMFFGLQFSRECYCGSSLKNPRAQSETECDMACVGNSDDKCGGSLRLSVYERRMSGKCPSWKTFDAVEKKQFYIRTSKKSIKEWMNYESAYTSHLSQEWILNETRHQKR